MKIIVKICFARFFFLVSVAVVFLGCDFFREENDRELTYRIEKERQEAQRRDRTERMEAMRVYLKARCGLVQGKLQSVTNELRVLRKDAVDLEQEMARIIKSENKNDVGLSYEVQLLRILRNKKVNDLAVKYLAEGFGLQTEEFVEKVREARSEERRFKEAMKKSEELYNDATKGTSDWVGASRKQRDAEIRRLENEIEVIERKRKTTRREMIPSGSHRREWMSKMRDYEEEIRRKRQQIDYLRNPDVNRNIETRAASRVQDIQRAAARTKDERDFNIHRRLKPHTTVTKVADEVAGKTIEKLREELKSRIDAKEAEKKNLLKKMEIANEIIIAIPVSDIGDLNRLRAKAEKEL